MNTSSIVVWSIRGVIVLAFVALAYKEIALLFVSRGKNMGTGWGRVWAIARTTLFESWASRIWLLPVLWLVVALLLIMAVRPFDETERIPLYIRMLLGSQEVLLLVMMWVMACVSLPRERERKIIITNASKPLSRLEMILGKITGFTVAAGIMVLVMMAASLVILYISDARLKSRAAQALALQQNDRNTQSQTPPELLKQLANEGSLFAYNSIHVPRDSGFNIGSMAFPNDAQTEAVRFLIGGTTEKAIYTFSPTLLTPDFVPALSKGQRPYFEFLLPIIPTSENPPKNVKIRVTARSSNPNSTEEKELILDSQGQALWEPDRPETLYTLFDVKSLELTRPNGPVTIEITCPTPGVMLQILEGSDPEGKNQLAANTMANVDFVNRISEYLPGNPQTLNFPSAKPLVRGFERRDRQQINGPASPTAQPEWAIYRFPAASLRHVPIDEKGNFTLSLLMETDKTDNPGDPTFAHIFVQSLDRGSMAPPYENKHLEVTEKRLASISIPAANLGNKDPAKRSDLIVLVRCVTKGHAISLIDSSVRIELPQTPFFLNFFKSELILFMEAGLLVALSVMCSIRLGWAISMLLSGVAYAFGSMVSYIASISEFGGLAALNYQSYGQATSLYNFLDSTAGITWKFLGFMSILAPNFSMFQPQDYITNLENIPWAVVGNNAINTVIYAIPLLGLGHLIFRKQELG